MYNLLPAKLIKLILNKKWREENKEYDKERKRKYGAVKSKLCTNCGELIKNRGIKYCSECKEIAYKDKKKKRDLGYYKENKKNPKYKENRNQKQKDKLKNNMQFNLKVRLRNQFKTALNKYLEEDKIIISRNKNIDYRAIFEHLTPFPDSLSEYDIDHIIPLAFFDLTDPEQLNMAWNPINLQWLKSGENRSKNAKIDFKKYPEQKMVWDKLGLDKLIDRKVYKGDIISFCKALKSS